MHLFVHFRFYVTVQVLIDKICTFCLEKKAKYGNIIKKLNKLLHAKEVLPKIVQN